MCLSFIPSEIFNSKITKKIKLEPRDIVYFFPRSSRDSLISGLIADLRKQSASDEKVQIVKINGAIHFPGSYPYTNAMTLMDLFRAAPCLLIDIS